VGATNYANLIRDNNAFIHSIVTIPIGDFQHDILDIPFLTDSTTDIDTTTLTELIDDQPWCLNIKKTTTANKVLITTTKENLSTARQWIDDTLPTIYSQFIADKIDVTMLKNIIPHCLDKPVLTTASTTYANKLKARTNNITTAAATTKQFAKPPALKPNNMSILFSTTKNSPA